LPVRQPPPIRWSTTTTIISFTSSGTTRFLDRDGNKVGYLRGSRIYDLDKHPLYRVKGSRLYDDRGNAVGKKREASPYGQRGKGKY
jgi:hypothetical protein